MILFTILLIMLFVLLIASAITILIMGIGGIAFVLACSDIIICIYLVFMIIRPFIKRKNLLLHCIFIFSSRNLQYIL